MTVPAVNEADRAAKPTQIHFPAALPSDFCDSVHRFVGKRTKDECSALKLQNGVLSLWETRDSTQSLNALTAWHGSCNREAARAPVRPT
jgi:hypothetical protein